MVTYSIVANKLRQRLLGSLLCNVACVVISLYALTHTAFTGRIARPMNTHFPDNGLHTASKGVGLRRQRGCGMSAKDSDEEYPELKRVEGSIYDSCLMQEGDQEIECLRMWDKLVKYHEEAKVECRLDDTRCVVLDVLDKLCAGIDGTDGLALLNRVSSAMLAFREKFVDGHPVFVATDGEKDGGLSMDELVIVLEELDAGLSAADVALVFRAADADSNGLVTKEEFDRFMTAVVFAYEQLSALQPDYYPKKQPAFEEYLHWTSKGHMSLEGQSWANMGKFKR